MDEQHDEITGLSPGHSLVKSGELALDDGGALRRVAALEQPSPDQLGDLGWLAPRSYPAICLRMM